MVSILGKDFALYSHLLIGILLIVLPIIILFKIASKNYPRIKSYSLITAILSWLLLFTGGRLYLIFYPATKTLIKAGSRPWVHEILMETKEHWGLLLPLIATTAAILIYSNKLKESKKWWQLLIIISTLLGIMGWIISNRGAA